MLLTRYTFVNTLERVKPLITDWTLPLPAPEGLQPSQLPVSTTGSVGSAALGGDATWESAAGGRKPLERGTPSEAVHKRDHFMARMSRRVMRSPR